MEQINESVDVIENVEIEYYVPISEEMSNDGKTFVIRGTAIEATTSRNGITYTAEELNNARVENSPLLKDHEAKIDNIVGRVDFEKEDGKIRFKANIEDDSVKEKLSKRLIRNVSIGAIINKLVKDVKEGVTSWIASGIEIVELSLVAVPGVKTATIDQAIMEKYGSKMNKIEDLKTEQKMELKEIKKVLEEEGTEEPETAEPEAEPATEEAEEEKEKEEPKESEAEEKLDLLTTELVSMKKSMKEMQKSLDNKAKGMKKAGATSPEWASGEIQTNVSGHLSREWNPNTWKNNIYR